MIGYQLILQRLMSARFHTKFAKMTIIQAYVPNIKYDAKKLADYDTLQKMR